MKKCAKCGADYDDSYDGCPACAGAEKRAGGAAVGCMGAAFLAFAVVVVGAFVFFVVATNGAYTR